MPQFADIFTGGYSKPGVRADFIAAPATTTQKSFDALTTADVPATTEIADDSEKCMKADCDCGCDDKPKRPKLKSILQASRELLQATTKSAGEGVWRTIEGDQKVFIQDGEVRAGGPAGPVIGGKKPSTKPKPTKKPDPKPKAKKQEAIPGSNIPKDAKPFATPSKAVTEQIGKAQEGWLQRHAEASGTTPEKLKTEWTSKVKEMTAKAKVYIRMPPEVVDLVLEEGRYKSQFETNSSFGGDVQIEGRSEFELHQFGVPADTPDNQRPVYGYASDQTPYSRAKYQPGTKVKIAGNHDSTATYGRVVVELKDSVKDRSSITFGDSMNASGETLPTPMRSPDYRSLDFSNYGDGKMKTPRPIQTGSVDATAKYDGQYTEVQVHYGATTNDIAKVWMDRPPSAKTQSLLKKRGIEWEVMK